MTIDGLQLMIDDFGQITGKRLLLKSESRVARLLLDQLRTNPEKVRQYNPETLEGVIRDFEKFGKIIDAGESYSDIEAANSCVLEKNIIWIAMDLLELMQGVM